VDRELKEDGTAVGLIRLLHSTSVSIACATFSERSTAWDRLLASLRLVLFPAVTVRAAGMMVSGPFPYVMA
jgi:hypothetical protein